MLVWIISVSKRGPGWLSTNINHVCFKCQGGNHIILLLSSTVKKFWGLWPVRIYNNTRQRVKCILIIDDGISCNTLICNKSSTFLVWMNVLNISEKYNPFLFFWTLWASPTGLTAVSKLKPRLPAQWAVGTHRKGTSRMEKVTSRMNWPIRNWTQIRIRI